MNPIFSGPASDKVSKALKSSLGGGVGGDGRPLLEIVGGLGVGGWAYVLKARHTETGNTCALKVVDKAGLREIRDRERLKMELAVMAELPFSPFVQRCSLAFESPTHVYMATELLAGGDLFSRLVTQVQAEEWGFGEDAARVLLAETVSGLVHLHAHGFIHRDIKVDRGGREAHANRNPPSLPHPPSSHPHKLNHAPSNVIRPLVDCFLPAATTPIATFSQSPRPILGNFLSFLLFLGVGLSDRELDA